MKKIKGIVLVLIICFVATLISVHKFYYQNQFNRKNAVFEFFAQEADARNPDGYIDNSFDNRIGYYIGIDKYKNLYVTGIKRSNRLIDLWADHLFSETRTISEITEDDINEARIKDNNMKLDDFIIEFTSEFQKKISDEEYDQILNLMDEVEKTYLKDSNNPLDVLWSGYVDIENEYIHLFKYNNKYYPVGSLIYSQELGGYYKDWGETATNNIIRVRGIIDKYIDDSIDPQQFNFSEWEFYIDKQSRDYKVYVIPDDLYNY